jgi:mono/diheme cytochrome c family protein
LALIIIAAGAAWEFLTRPHLSAEEKGRRLAERTGCFACHGPDGSGGVFNDGSTNMYVPDWKGELMMFAHDSAQIRQWIHDGVTEARAASKSWKEERAKGILKMQAFGNRLSSGQIDELVAYVMAVNQAVVPHDSLTAQGMNRADSLGCFGCHGIGGRMSRHNPGSFKGYVPSWNGRDFPDLVRDRAEFDQWVKNGISDRFEQNRLAKYFLDRAVLKMPAYRDHLKTGDLNALWAYIEWLRSTSESDGNEEASN